MIRALASLLVLLLGAAPLLAAPPVADPDWPCMQRLVPTLKARSYWDGLAPDSDWHADPAVTAAVAAAAPRAVPQNSAVAKLRGFAAGLPQASRAILFAGLVDETNRQRSEIIDRLRALTRRQRDIARIVAGIPDPGPDADDTVRDEVVQRRAFLVREFEETERTIRYACEIPVELEARLGAFARALSGAQ